MGKLGVISYKFKYKVFRVIVIIIIIIFFFVFFCFFFFFDSVSLNIIVNGLSPKTV